MNTNFKYCKSNANAMPPEMLLFSATKVLIGDCRVSKFTRLSELL